MGVTGFADEHIVADHICSERLATVYSACVAYCAKHGAAAVPRIDFKEGSQVVLADRGVPVRDIKVNKVSALKGIGLIWRGVEGFCPDHS